MSDNIRTVDELRDIIAKPIAMIADKELDFLDDGARSWISKTPLVFFGFGDDRPIAMTLAGGHAGFISTSTHELQIPVSMVDFPEKVKSGLAFGSMFLLPGIKEILRVNGRVKSVDHDMIYATVDECYTHCGKALLRSDFWSWSSNVVAPDDAAGFASASCFMALATINAEGRADMSPKGDMVGMMARIEGDTLWFADRPGNRRLDSFQNILTQPQVSAMLLIPGSTKVACLSGAVRLTTDEAIRAKFTVQDKVPVLAVEIGNLSIELRDSATLARADLVTPTEGINATKIGIAQAKLKKGLGFKLASTLGSIPGLMDKAVEQDYKKTSFEAIVVDSLPLS